MTCESVRGDRVAVVHARRVALAAAQRPRNALLLSCFDVGRPPAARRCAANAAMRRAGLRLPVRGLVPVELLRPVSVVAHVAARHPFWPTPAGAPTSAPRGRVGIPSTRHHEPLSARRPRHRLKSHVQEFENLSFEDVTHWEVKLHTRNKITI